MYGTRYGVAGEAGSEKNNCVDPGEKGKMICLLSKHSGGRALRIRKGGMNNKRNVRNNKKIFFLFGREVVADFCYTSSS
jgi:hypothetical protein